MMSSTKSQDGYSKILSKSDCDKLKGLGKRTDVDLCEHLAKKNRWLSFLFPSHSEKFLNLWVVSNMPGKCFWTAGN